MKEDDSEFPYSDYEKSLERVLDQATKEYWSQILDINRNQVEVGRTYLWVSGGLLAAYSAAASLAQHILPQLPIYLYVVSFAAAILAVVAFGICLYALPSRNGYRRVGQSWGTFSKLAFDALSEKKRNVYRLTLTAMVDGFDDACKYNLSTNTKRASLLRLTSWILLASFCLAFSAGVLFAVIYTTIPKKEESTMAKQGKVTPQAPVATPSGQQATPASVPDTPAPQGPLLIPGTTITHGQDGAGTLNLIVTPQERKKK